MKTRTNINTLQPPETGMDYGDRMYVSDKPYEEQMRQLSGQAVRNNAGEYPESEFNVPTDDTGSYEEMEYWFPWGFDLDPSWELYPIPQLDALPPFVELPEIELPEIPSYVISEGPYNVSLEHLIFDLYVNWNANSWQTSHDAANSLSEDYITEVASVRKMDDGAGEYIDGCVRAFSHFSMAGVVGNEVISAYLRISVLSVPIGSGSSVVSVQEATHTPQAPPPQSTYSAFTGNLFASGTFANGEWIDLPFNSEGLAYLTSVIGDTAKFCFRDYTYDYLNVVPAEGDIDIRDFGRAGVFGTGPPITLHVTTV